MEGKTQILYTEGPADYILSDRKTFDLKNLQIEYHVVSLTVTDIGTRENLVSNATIEAGQPILLMDQAHGISVACLAK